MLKMFRDNLQINEWKFSQVGDWSCESVILQEPANKQHATDQTNTTMYNKSPVWVCDEIQIKFRKQGRCVIKTKLTIY